MTNKIIQLLVFLKLVDKHDRCVSLTSVGLMVVLAKVGFASNPGVADLGALLGTLLLYAHKRYLGASTAAKEDELNSLAGHLVDAAKKIEALEVVTKTAGEKLIQLDNRTQAQSQAHVSRR